MSEIDGNGGGGAPPRRRRKVERPGKACECGNPKAVGAYACDRCRRLEGKGFTADSRPWAMKVGTKEREWDTGLMKVDRALTGFLRERGLIDESSWRKSNNGITK
jgi:hypothetical protein